MGRSMLEIPAAAIDQAFADGIGSDFGILAPSAQDPATEPVADGSLATSSALPRPMIDDVLLSTVAGARKY
jgi:hypothetical protein